MAEEDEFAADADEFKAVPDAAAVALSLDAPDSPDARIFLRKQSRMLDLQMQTMREQEALQMSHLRWRRFADRMRGLTWMLGLFVGTVVVAGSASASGPTGGSTYFRSRTATLHVQNVGSPSDEYSCLLTTGVIVFGTYPGYMRGYAYVSDCQGTPVPPTSCEAQAELQIYEPSVHQYVDDGSGSGVQTCFGSPSHESRVTKKCIHSPTLWDYRTKGSYIIHWEGRTYAYVKYSPTIQVTRIC